MHWSPLGGHTLPKLANGWLPAIVDCLDIFRPAMPVRPSPPGPPYPPHSPPSPPTHPPLPPALPLADAMLSSTYGASADERGVIASLERESHSGPLVFDAGAAIDGDWATYACSRQGRGNWLSVRVGGSTAASLGGGIGIGDVFLWGDGRPDGYDIGNCEVWVGHVPDGSASNGAARCPTSARKESMGAAESTLAPASLTSSLLPSSAGVLLFDCSRAAVLVSSVEEAYYWPSPTVAPSGIGGEPKSATSAGGEVAGRHAVPPLYLTIRQTGPARFLHVSELLVHEARIKSKTSHSERLPSPPWLPLPPLSPPQSPSQPPPPPSPPLQPLPLTPPPLPPMLPSPPRMPAHEPSAHEPSAYGTPPIHASIRSSRDPLLLIAPARTPVFTEPAIITPEMRVAALMISMLTTCSLLVLLTIGYCCRRLLQCRRCRTQCHQHGDHSSHDRSHSHSPIRGKRPDTNTNAHVDLYDSQLTMGEAMDETLDVAVDEAMDEAWGAPGCRTVEEAKEDALFRAFFGTEDTSEEQRWQQQSRRKQEPAGTEGRGQQQACVQDDEEDEQDIDDDGADADDGNVANTNGSRVAGPQQWGACGSGGARTKHCRLLGRAKLGGPTQKWQRLATAPQGRPRPTQSVADGTHVLGVADDPVDEADSQNDGEFC